MQVKYLLVNIKNIWILLSKKTERCKLNPHWRPFYRSHCHYCDLYYQVIGKLETWSQDIHYAVKVKNDDFYIYIDIYIDISLDRKTRIETRTIFNSEKSIQ